MASLLLILFLVLVFVGVPLGLGFAIYSVPKKLGYPKAAKFLAIGFGILVAGVALYAVFEDRFFTKKKARELLEEQGIKLAGNFKLLKNESSFAIGDYYHIFIIEISEGDKQILVSSIKNADNFKTNPPSVDTLMYHTTSDRYFGKKHTRNYENNDSYVREYFEPGGREGYSPVYRRISLSKTKTELTFEDIDN